MSKKNSKKSLKKLKEELDEYFGDKNEEQIKNQIFKIINSYPKDSYGYLKLIEYETNDFKKYLKDDELKKIKDAYDYLDEKIKESIKNKYNEYLYDIKEVNNLIKIRKNLISKYFLKQLYDDIFLSLNINKISFNAKIKSSYNLINGLFLLFCLIINLIKPNLFLILTIPLGIFGIVNVFCFFDKNKLNKTNGNIDDSLFLSLKDEIKKIDNNIEFYLEEKKISLSKIPQSFKNDIENIEKNNEQKQALLIYSSFKDNNLVVLSALLQEYTNLKIIDINDIIKNYIDIEKKKKSNFFTYIKKISLYNYFIITCLIIISIFTSLYIFKNKDLYYSISFYIGILVGIIKIIIYNAEDNYKININKIFFSIIRSVVFSSTLIYDIIYLSRVSDIDIIYLLLVIPITFLFLFSGFVMLVSFFKYNKLLKKIKK